MALFRWHWASGEFVSGNYFSMLGVPALVGWTFATRDDTPDGRVAVLGFGYWQKRLGADPGVIGRAITVNGVPFRIAAVTPHEFYDTSMDRATDIMLPPRDDAAGGRRTNVGAGAEAVRFRGIRLRACEPGMEKRAAAELTAIFRQEALSIASTGTLERGAAHKFWIELTPGGRRFSTIRGRFFEPLKVLMVVVGLVMLIACANIANLMLARASARQREIAIRLSLGSGRWRLVRQMRTESVLLSLLGGALGLLVAIWARDGIILLGTRSETAPAIPAAWNWRVLGFTAGISILNAEVRNATGCRTRFCGSLRGRLAPGAGHPSDARAAFLRLARSHWAVTRRSSRHSSNRRPPPARRCW